MDYFDLIKELRKGEPDISKSAKAVKILGWICFLGAVWNYVIYYLGPFQKSPFNLPPSYPYVVLISLLLLGSIFFLAAHDIKSKEPRGKKLAQLGVVLFIGLIIAFTFILFARREFSFFRNDVPIIFIVFFSLFILQFTVPAYFAFRYLGRLPVNVTEYSAAESRRLTIQQGAVEGLNRDRLGLQLKYKDSPSPFGVFGTFSILIVVPLFIIMIALKYIGPQAMPFVFFPMFLLIFIGPVWYNRVQSPFELEKGRNLIASYTGGGSIFLFNGSWPFFRLLVYQDGVEIRVIFQRYFIPYDKMYDVPDKVGFFSRGILFKSNLPDVPSCIRFQGFGMKKIVKVVYEMRSQSMAKEKR